MPPLSGTRFTGLATRTLPGGLSLISATTLRARLRGVGGLDRLPDGVGVELPAGSIHTYTVRFALDLIWRDRDGGVLRIDRDVPRWRMRVCWGARSVIECNAGSADMFVAALAASRAETAG